jgi:enoyl-CoA hydratase/carnithine racemase
MVEELKIFTEVAYNEVRAMVITGEGDKAYCTVGDLEFFKIENYDDIEIGFSPGWKMFVI